MVKSELIERLALDYTHRPYQQIKNAVEALTGQMSETLARGERIEIRGFGSFSLHVHPPRISRNPKTGESVAVAQRHSIHFKPGKELRIRVNNGNKF